MIDMVYAMGASRGASNAQQGGFSAFVPLILMFIVFYFLLIRPQQKKTKEHQEMINNLKKGDRVLTTGGIHGRITSLDEAIAKVEIAQNVEVKIQRANVSALLSHTSEKQAKKTKSTKK